MEHSVSNPRWTGKAATLLLLAIVCSATVALSVRLAGANLKTAGVVLLALAFPAAAVYYSRVKEMLIFGWIVSLTYNRQYFSFESLTGNIGTQGPYWIAGDICFLALLLLWAFQVAFRKRRTEAKSPRLWPWFLPLAFACLLSVAAADRPDWSLYELIRFAKFGLVLAYVRHNFGKREWIIAVASLGLAMSFQSIVGAKEIITGHSGVLGMGGQVTGVDGFENVFSQENFYGWVRATGTMNHPPNLACYLILVLPVFLACGFTMPQQALRRICGCVFLLGCVGLGCTLSRWPWALAAGEAALVLAGLVLLRETRFHRAAGVALVGIFALMVALVPLRDKLMDRLTRDFTDSVNQRADGNRIATAMIEENPWFGVGLNNSKLHILKYMPELEWAVENEDLLTHVMKSRSLAAMGNGFFFVTVETGVFGTLGFAICLIGALVTAVRSVLLSRGAVRGVCLGMCLGLVGVLLQQLIDFSLWVDPLLYTTALCIGLLNVAPGLFAKEAAKATASVPALMTRSAAA